MNLDLLDTSYTMVKYILHFEQIHQTVLTGLRKRSDRFSQLYQFWWSTEWWILHTEAYTPSTELCETLTRFLFSDAKSIFYTGAALTGLGACAR